jgi:hypothetical protein
MLASTVQFSKNRQHHPTHTTTTHQPPKKRGDLEMTFDAGMIPARIPHPPTTLIGM